MDEVLLKCENLSFSYDKDIVLENVNLEVKSGDFLAIIGPNGGGKTTLVKLFLGLLESNHGHIYKSPNLSNIGYVPQNTNLNATFPLSSLDVVLMGKYSKNIFGYRPNANDKNKALEIMESLNISHLASRLLAELSGGERQKVLIARALLGNPKMLIFDEPTASIDALSQNNIYKLLQEINQSHTIIVISHDISVILGYAKSVIYVNKHIHSHDVPMLNFDLDSHICEIDILNQFNQCIKEKNNETSRKM